MKKRVTQILLSFVLSLQVITLPGVTFAEDEVRVYDVAEKTVVKGDMRYELEGVVVAVNLTLSDFRHIKELVQLKGRDGDRLTTILPGNALSKLSDDKLEELEGVSQDDIVTAFTWDGAKGNLAGSGQKLLLMRVGQRWALVTIHHWIS